LGEDTLAALRHVKDAILKKHSLASFHIDAQLRSSVKQARKRYESDLVEKRKLDARVDFHSKFQQQSTSKSETSIEDKICETEIGIRVADDIIAEGNEKLPKLLSKVPLNEENSSSHKFTNWNGPGP